MALLLATVASISLVVGGIAIMNILLVSLTERLREVGIRKANILPQFLIEAVLLSLIGGLEGILAGVALSQTISVVLAGPHSFWQGAIVGGFLFSAVGVFFSYYPALQASLLNPIDALRYE
jgi:macrolide transport system ATP-binding/permease protein